MERWKRTAAKRVYDGYRKVDRISFRSQTGWEGDFDILDDGRTVCILALTADNRVVLAKQFRPGPNEVLFELPGGGIDGDERPLDAARRELLEETGYEGDLEFVTESFHGAYSNLLRHSFVATNCRKVAEPSNADGEFTEPVLMQLEDFKRHLQSGQLTDMGTGYRCLDFLGLL